MALFKFLQKCFIESIPYLAEEGGSFCSSVIAILAKNVGKTFEMDFGSYLTTLSSLRAFIVAMETLFGNQVLLGFFTAVSFISK